MEDLDNKDMEIKYWPYDTDDRYFVCSRCGEKIWRRGNSAFYTCSSCGCFYRVRELTQEEKNEIMESAGGGFEWWK